MRAASNITLSAGRAAAAFRKDQSGGVLIEFALVVAVFLFLFAALLDFGRLSYSGVTAQNASQLAARIAAVRPPACAGLPLTNQRGPSTLNLRFGTSCSAAAGVCSSVPTISCTGDAANPTAAEIWGRVNPLLPIGSTIDMLQFTYSYDSNIGFLGGPYSPMLTVELALDDFQFVSPLAALANAAGATNSSLGTAANYSSFSVSLPAEDLATGESR